MSRPWKKLAQIPAAVAAIAALNACELPVSTKGSAPVTSTKTSTGTGSSTVTSTATNTGSSTATATSTAVQANPELATPTYLNLPNGYFQLSSGQSISVNGISLRLTTGGDLQVVNGAGTLFWRSNTSASCGGGACTLVMQNDGNLVLSGPGGPYWSSGTYNYAGAFLTLSSSAPYLSIRDGNFNVTWNSDGTSAGPTALTSDSRVGPVAAPVRAFLDSLAVNSHVDQNGISSTNMLAMLNYLGVYTIRDGWNSGLNATYTTMAQAGVKFNLGMGDPYAASAFDGAHAIAAMAPGALSSVEGPNEINNWSFVVNGVTSPNGWPNAAGPLVQDFMTKLLAMTHADAALNGVKVYDLTWAGTTNAQNYGMLDLGPQADFGNVHLYPPGQPYRALQTAIAGSYHHVLPSQAVVTEAGYDTSSVSEAAQAILNLNLYLGGFQQGVHKIFLYELYDEWQTYGLFHSDFTPKASATAIHNLTTILADAGAGGTGTLNYSLTNLPATAHSLLLQKTNGKFELIVWNEVPVYASGADLAVTPVTVGAAFGQTVSNVKVYDPLSGTTATQQANTVASLSLSLGAHALVLEITP